LMLKNIESIEALCKDTAAMAMQYAHAVLKIGVRTDVLERQLSAIASDGHSGLVQNNGWMVSSTPASCEEHQELENDTASDKSSSLFTRLAMLEDSALKSCTLFDHVDSISQRLCSLESAIRTPSRCRVPPSLVPTRLHGDVRNKTTTVQHPVRYKSAPDDVNTEKLTPHGVTEHSDCKAVQENFRQHLCNAGRGIPTEPPRFRAILDAINSAAA